LTRFIRNEDEFMELVIEELPILLNQTNAGVVVFDSIASMFRSQQDEITRRSGNLFVIAAQLKKLSQQYRVPMVVINQVTTKFVTGPSQERHVPSLGLSWANCVNCSYHLERDDQYSTSDGTQRVSGRRLIVRKSPKLSRLTIPFVIEDRGAVQCR